MASLGRPQKRLLPAPGREHLSYESLKRKSAAGVALRLNLTARSFLAPTSPSTKASFKEQTTGCYTSSNVTSYLNMSRKAIKMYETVMFLFWRMQHCLQKAVANNSNQERNMKVAF